MDVAAISHIGLLVIFMVLMPVMRTGAFQEPDRKVYIVYMGEVPSEEQAATTTHRVMLESVLRSRVAAEKSLLYSYGRSFNGFAAILSPSEAEEFSKMHGVVSVFEDKKKHLHTTRSWDFVGFPESAKRNLRYENDVIVGMLDTGIWPESESFDDQGLGPPPSKWKGKCQTSSNFTKCNNKVIGARYYNKSPGQFDPVYDYESPRDSIGHGTHTASTAAGNIVRNANLFGLAEGDARGGVPGARIAVYKICWENGCSEADILAAFDDAIQDGVDIISISVGSSFARAYFEDSIAIGSFHAMKNGILTSSSAGNSGPETGTVSNYSPWSLTVAASTIDRHFHNQLLLGNKQAIRGLAINTFSPTKPWYPLINGRDAANASGGSTPDLSSLCELDSLDRQKVEGKIVLCGVSLLGSPDESVFLSGGAGVIIAYDVLHSDYSLSFMIPATIIRDEEAEVVKAYINSTRSPEATILKSGIDTDSASPAAASFSSRGPNPITTNILKPDISAPGVDILASWSKAASMTGSAEDKRFVNFNIISGTSMSCPHVSAVAAYVKSFHPHWSPAAIKSAIMTTANPMDADYVGNEDGELAFGSGQIDPARAIDPGLLYDAGVNSYIDFLCNEGYDINSLRLLTGENATCSKVAPAKGGAWALNYPSIMIAVKKGNPISVTFLRKVTNVGSTGHNDFTSTYGAVVNAPSGIQIIVQPSTLSFTSPNQTLSFTVQVKGKAFPSNTTLLSGSLTWTFGNYSVRSPIVIYSDDAVSH